MPSTAACDLNALCNLDWGKKRLLCNDIGFVILNLCDGAVACVLLIFENTGFQVKMEKKKNLNKTKSDKRSCERNMSCTREIAEDMEDKMTVG